MHDRRCSRHLSSRKFFGVQDGFRSFKNFFKEGHSTCSPFGETNNNEPVVSIVVSIMTDLTNDAEFDDNVESLVTHFCDKFKDDCSVYVKSVYFVCDVPFTNVYTSCDCLEDKAGEEKDKGKRETSSRVCPSKVTMSMEKT